MTTVNASHIRGAFVLWRPHLGKHWTLGTCSGDRIVVADVMRTAGFLGLALVASSLLSAGCRFGEASFETSFDDVPFDPGGTVFAYLDERDSAVAEDADPRVVVAMTWIVFDAASDLTDNDGAALAGMAHEMSLRDGLSIVFDRQGVVDADSTFEGTRTGDTLESSDGVDFTLYLAPERLDTNSSFEEITPFASRRTIKVTVEEASFDDVNPVIAGTIDIGFEAVAGRDPGKAREGTITGRFRAPLVGERVAEKNLAALKGAGDIDVLGLPLGDRVGGPTVESEQ